MRPVSATGIPMWARAAMVGRDIGFEAAGNMLIDTTRMAEDYLGAPRYSAARDLGESVVQRARSRINYNSSFVKPKTSGEKFVMHAATAIPAIAAGAVLALSSRGKSIPNTLSGMGGAWAVQQALPTYNDSATVARVVGYGGTYVEGDPERTLSIMRARISPGSAAETAFDSVPAALTAGGKTARFQPMALFADAVQGVSGARIAGDMRKIASGRGASFSPVEQLKQLGAGAAGYLGSKLDIPGGHFIDPTVAYASEYLANVASNVVGTEKEAERVSWHAMNLKALEIQEEKRRQLTLQQDYQGVVQRRSQLETDINRFLEQTRETINRYEQGRKRRK